MRPVLSLRRCLHRHISSEHDHAVCSQSYLLRLNALLALKPQYVLTRASEAEEDRITLMYFVISAFKPCFPAEIYEDIV